MSATARVKDILVSIYKPSELQIVGAKVLSDQNVLSTSS